MKHTGPGLPFAPRSRPSSNRPLGTEPTHLPHPTPARKVTLAARFARWREHTPFVAHATVTLERPFHTPLHLCEAITREADFSQHAREWKDRNAIRLSRDLFTSIEASFFQVQARMPTHVHVRTVGGCGRKAILEVAFGSPYCLAVDALLGLALLVVALGAFAEGSLGTAVLVLYCIAVGVVPSVLLERRSRAEFRAALRRATGETPRGEVTERAS